MSRMFRIRFACLATAISLAAVAALTLTAEAGAKPIIPAVHMLSAASVASPTTTAMGGAAASSHAAAATATPLRTPSPEAGSIPRATSTSGDLLPSGLSLPGVIAVLAVAALLAGISLTISRGGGATRRVHEQQLTVGKVAKAPSAARPVGRAA